MKFAIALTLLASAMTFSSFAQAKQMQAGSQVTEEAAEMARYQAFLSSLRPLSSIAELAPFQFKVLSEETSDSSSACMGAAELAVYGPFAALESGDEQVIITSDNLKIPKAEDDVAGLSFVAKRGSNTLMVASDTGAMFITLSETKVLFQELDEETLLPSTEASKVCLASRVK